MNLPACILVVDDDPALRWTTARILTRAGYSVESAETGEEGLRLAGEQKPDLILLDVVLPGIDGLEVCRRIKTDPALKSVYVLLVSSERVDTLDQAAALEGGADGYIIRPVSNRELLARVEAMLRLKRAEDGLRARTLDLAQRVRELDCLHAMAHLFDQELPLAAKLEAAARLLPCAWPESEIACARVTLDGVHYPSMECTGSPWKLVAPLCIAGAEVGSVQISYQEQRSFTPEHRKLLDLVADQLGHMIERTRAEEALQWSEERFRAVFHQAHDGILLLDQTGVILDWNQAMEQITGLPAASVLGRSAAELEAEIDPAGRTASGWRAAVQLSLSRAANAGGAEWLGQPVEGEYPHPDGSRRFLAASFFRVATPRGLLLGSVIRDVTERRQAEAALVNESAINAAMAALASALIHAGSIDQIADLVLDHARRLTASPYGLAGYVAPGQAHLALRAMMGESGEGSRVVDAERSVEHLRGLSGWVLKHRQSLLTNRPGDDPRADHVPPGHPPLRRFLAVPAVVNDVLMGEIALLNSSRDYTPFDLALVERLASLYAVAIQRAHTEQTLRESEQRLRSLLESAPDAIVLVDAHGRMVFANVQAEESFGYARAELLGRPVELLVPEGLQKRHAQHRAEYTANPPPRSMSTRPGLPARRKDGRHFPVDIKLSPTVMQGEFLVTAIIRDVTEREETQAALRRARDELEDRVQARTAELAEANRDLLAEIARREEAEQALRATEARLRQLAAHVDEALWLTDVDTGQLLYISPVFSKMAGIPADEAAPDPRSLMEVVYPDDRERLARALADRQAGCDLECRLLRDDGGIYWVRIRSFPIRDQAGRVYRVAGLAQDITEAREAQAAMIQNERLAMAGKLAASLAHEINNPLQSAMGCLSLVRESLVSGDDPSPFLLVVESELARTARIVSQLRTLSRPSAPRAREPLELNAVLEQVLVFAKKQLSAAGIATVTSLAQDLPRLLLSSDEMRQVLLNLVLNAIDAMPRGGVLEVTTARCEPDAVIVRLVDSGGGMSPATLKQLFDPFYSTKPDGLGLGLFVTQNIVRAHGGRIAVDSEPGKGSTFSVWLPLEPPDEVNPETDRL